MLIEDMRSSPSEVTTSSAVDSGIDFRIFTSERESCWTMVGKEGRLEAVKCLRDERTMTRTDYNYLGSDMATRRV